MPEAYEGSADVEAEMLNDEPHKHMDTLETILSTLLGKFLYSKRLDGDFEKLQERTRIRTKSTGQRQQRQQQRVLGKGRRRCVSYHPS